MSLVVICPVLFTRDVSALTAAGDAGRVPFFQQSLAAETERMMKLQDVLLKAMAKKITWWDAAEIVGVTDQTMRRWRERMDEHGYSGLMDRRKENRARSGFLWRPPRRCCGCIRKCTST
ncbi:MAG: helix-turn-helix domain-containing protein [Bryobacteraceae bacterium]